MTFGTLPATRRLFVAGLVFFVFSLVFSIANVVTVLSAPLRTAVTVPQRIGFQGYAADGSGDALDTGTYTVTVNVYDAATGGTSVWSHAYVNTAVTDGLYSLTLDGPFGDDDFNGDRWIGVAINGGAEITPRSKVASVPFALNAQQAQSVDWTGVQDVPADLANGDNDALANLTCANGKIAKRVGGAWACDDDLIGDGNIISGGAAGRIPVFNSPSTLAGSNNLIYANYVLTTTSDIAYTGTLKTIKNGTTNTGYIFVPVDPTGLPWTSSSFDGDNKTTGDYAIDVSTFTSGTAQPPANTSHIKAYYVRMIGEWTAASDSNYAGLQTSSSVLFHSLVARAHVANLLYDITGIVIANSNGDFNLEVAGATMNNCYIQIFGYFV